MFLATFVLGNTALIKWVWCWANGMRDSETDTGILAIHVMRWSNNWTTNLNSLQSLRSGSCASSSARIPGGRGRQPIEVRAAHWHFSEGGQDESSPATLGDQKKDGGEFVWFNQPADCSFCNYVTYHICLYDIVLYYIRIIYDNISYTL